MELSAAKPTQDNLPRRSYKQVHLPNEPIVLGMLTGRISFSRMILPLSLPLGCMRTEHSH